MDRQFADLRRDVELLNQGLFLSTAQSTAGISEVTADVAQVRGSVAVLRADVLTSATCLQFWGLILVVFGACLAVVPTVFNLK